MTIPTRLICGRKRSVDGRLRGQSGQALTEAALVIVVLTLLMLGVVEFGRAYLVVTTITNAARVGARSTALAPTANRDKQGYLLQTSDIESRVRDEIAAVAGPNIATALSVTVSQTGDPPMAQVRVAGDVPYIFRVAGTSFRIDRTVTYRDEGRG